MCFGSKPPPVTAPPRPPTERDANLNGLDARRRAAAAAKASGLESTISTSASGLTGAAPTYKATLGG